MLAFMTGMRQGERLGLTRDELRRDGDRLVVLVEWQAQHLTKREVEDLPKGVECTPLGNGMYRTRPKTEKGRRAIPLPDALARVLLAHIERHGVNGDGLVFHDDEGLPLTGNVERRRWYRALNRIGLDHDYVPHSARHTTATILNRLGLDDVTRTAIMGHSRMSTTNEIYTHVELDRLVAATDGAGRLRTYWQVTVPLLAPHLGTICILSCIWDFNIFNQIWLLTQGGPDSQTATIGVYTYRQAFVGFRIGEGSAISVVTMVILFVLTLAYLRRLASEHDR